MLKLKFVLPVVAGWLIGSVMGSDTVVINENFSADPVMQGWRTFGDASLFHWNAANQNLEVTWDSSHPNSYFYKPLGIVLARDDDFSCSFDLRLHDIMAGSNPDKVFTFQIAIGFINWSSAVAANFYRGTGMDSPNLVEFEYFPDSGYGATVSPVMISSNMQYAYVWIYQELTASDLFHVEMHYSGANSNLLTTLTRNGVECVRTNNVLGAAFTDFRVDTFSVSSFSDEGQDPDWDGSVLAHGTVDNIAISIPEPLGIEIACNLTNGASMVSFASRTNYTYQLEGSADLKAWSTVASVRGTGEMLSVQDTNTLPGLFYRVTAVRP